MRLPLLCTRRIAGLAKALLLPLLLFLLLISCSQQIPQPPSDALPRDKFKRVLMESQLIEARLNHEMIIDKRLDTPVKTYYAEMFKQQGVSEEMFKKTFEWYAEHPEQLKPMYEEILVDLQHRTDSLAH